MRHASAPKTVGILALPGVQMLWGGADLACRPCYDGRDYAPCASNLCIQSITVREAHDAVRDLLAEAAPIDHEGTV